jgi:hypothetical protein
MLTAQDGDVSDDQLQTDQQLDLTPFAAPNFASSDFVQHELFAENLVAVSERQFKTFLQAFDSTTRMQVYNAQVLAFDSCPRFKVKFLNRSSPSCCH